MEESLFSPPTFQPLSYLLEFKSEEEYLEFIHQLQDYAKPSEECCDGEPFRLKLEYEFDYRVFGEPVTPGNEDGCTAIFRCAFADQPPDWFLDRLVEFPGFSF